MDNLDISHEDTHRIHEIVEDLLSDNLAHQAYELYNLAVRGGSDWLTRLSISSHHALYAESQ